MAGAVWGIDIGQCGLKALRCKVGEDKQSLTADAFDFIEYPMVLSQPDANPQELVRGALTQFLSRNDLRGDKVAVAVTGQSGLARFIKLPPVEQKKIPDIVKYEAKQQIPFDLEDVIWDYQAIVDADQDEAALETEVGLFAMKRDQVFRAIRPLTDLDIELDVIQLAPLCLYNFFSFEHPVDQDAEEERPWTVLLGMGTDASDMVITNGRRVWQRSVPLGGSHFTKQLTKELKLTYAKAEHLKRNARQVKDPKALFQAMRPVFNDLVTEVQRSIRHFQNIERDAKLQEVVMLGNASKLPGIHQYLEKNLGMPVSALTKLKRLGGSSVTGAPAFKDNLPSFCTAYGLCVQGLGKANLSTNLLPREILTERMIRRKKPWAVATVGLLLLGLAVNFLTHNARARQVDRKDYEAAFGQVDSLASTSKDHISKDQEQLKTFEQLDRRGEAVVGTNDGRILIAELLPAVLRGLPKAAKFGEEKNLTTQDKIQQRGDLHITYWNMEYFPDLKTWFTPAVAKIYLNDRVGGPPPSEQGQADGGTQQPEQSGGSATAEADAAKVSGPEGPGWVIEIGGYHYHNHTTQNAGREYVRNNLIQYLEEGSVELPVPGDDAGKTMKFTLKQLGIGFPAIVYDVPPRVESIPDPEADATTASAEPLPSRVGRGEQPGAAGNIEVLRYDFKVQFSWKETRFGTRMKRLEEKAAEEAKQRKAREQDS